MLRTEIQTKNFLANHLSWWLNGVDVQIPAPPNDRESVYVKGLDQNNIPG